MADATDGGETVVAPVVPEAGDASVTTTPETTVAPAEPTPEDKAAEAEDNEWEDAQKEVFGTVKGKKKEGDDEQAKPEKDGEKKPEDKGDKTGKKPDEEQGAGDGAEKKDGDDKGAAEQPSTTARDARVAARETAQATEQMKTDVRTKMFAETPTQLQDADGDPISTIGDVMKLINPRTGEAFTDEEAASWLALAQQQFDKNTAAVSKQIDDITNVNMAVKDEADAVNEKYGKFLTENTEIKDRLWAQYEKTLVKDEKSGIITKAPVSLEEFYDVALKSYMDANAATEAKAADDAKAAEAAKIEADKAKLQQRQSRSDIYGGGNTDTTDPEEKEWADAATEVFGPKR